MSPGRQPSLQSVWGVDEVSGILLGNEPLHVFCFGFHCGQCPALRTVEAEHFVGWKCMSSADPSPGNGEESGSLVSTRSRFPSTGENLGQTPVGIVKFSRQYKGRRHRASGERWRGAKRREPAQLGNHLSVSLTCQVHVKFKAIVLPVLSALGCSSLDAACDWLVFIL